MRVYQSADNTWIFWDGYSKHYFNTEGEAKMAMDKNEWVTSYREGISKLISDINSLRELESGYLPLEEGDLLGDNSGISVEDITFARESFSTLNDSYSSISSILYNIKGKDFSSPQYAILENNLVKSIVIAEDSYAKQFTNYVLVTGLDPMPEIGWSYIDGQFAPPIPIDTNLLPILVITSVSPTGYALSDSNEITCPAGTVLHGEIEIRMPDNSTVIPLTQNFRLPVKSEDGREIVVLASFTDGVGFVDIPLRNSGLWHITEDLINRNLPVENRMKFEGVHIYVLEI